MPLGARCAIQSRMSGLHALFRRVFPDRFILILIGTVAIASVLPVSADATAAANVAVSAAIFVIFLLHGIRLPRAEVVAGLRDWRTQSAVAAFVFIAMPLIGWLTGQVASLWLPPLVAFGFVYCGVLPTTVQSATTYTSLARGAVAVSVIASAWINLAAIIVTPALLALLAGSAGGITLSGSLVAKIATILLLPFVIGQLVQRWVRPWVVAHAALVRTMDQSAIAIAVYVAFSAAVMDGIWRRLAGPDLAILMLLVVAMLAIAFAAAWLMGGVMRASSSTRAAILFASAHKSIAVGAPLAALLFPPRAAGVILLPILIYHLVQLILSAWIAPVLARAANRHHPLGEVP